MFVNILRYGIYKRKFPTTVSTLRTTNCFEIEYILSTSEKAQAVLNGKAYPLHSGTLLFRKPNQTTQSLPYFKCYYLHFEVDKDNPHYQELLSFPDYFTLINPQTYRTIFESLLHHIIKDAENLQDDFSFSKILELFYNLKKDAVYNTTIQNITTTNKLHLKNVLTYMKEHFNEKTTLEQLSSLAGYTPTYFQQLFVKTMHVSPQKYLEELRINHAKYLLSQDEQSISDIAYACGFSSQSYFSAVFKKYTLVTPYEFRQNAITTINNTVLN